MLRNLAKRAAAWRRSFLSTPRNRFGRRSYLTESLLLVFVIASFVGILTFTLGGLLSRSAKPTESADTREPLPSLPRIAELDLGETESIMATGRADGAASPGNVRVLQMKLAAEVDTKYVDYRSAQRQLQQYQQRVREAIGIVTRAATRKELAEPGLETLRARICTKLNQLIGEELFRDVAVQQFVAFEMHSGPDETRRR